MTFSLGQTLKCLEGIQPAMPRGMQPVAERCRLEMQQLGEQGRRPGHQSQKDGRGADQRALLRGSDGHTVSEGTLEGEGVQQRRQSRGLPADRGTRGCGFPPEAS